MESLESQLAAFFRDEAREVVSAYLFGSRARGTAHRQSDVDVAVLFERALLPERGDRSRAALALTTDLIALTHCNDVDLVVLNDATPELGWTAVDEGTRVFCRDDAADRDFRLRVQLRCIDLVPFLRRMRRIKAKALRS